MKIYFTVISHPISPFFSVLAGIKPPVASAGTGMRYGDGLPDAVADAVLLRY